MTLSIPIELTAPEALSGVLGSISLACWIFLLIPQLIENYRNGSAEAISLSFIFIWFIGDVTNLAGAIWARLVPTVIAIALYFCLTDGILIGQCLYYRWLNQRKQARKLKAQNADNETEPLLSRERTSSLTIPGSRRRSSATSKKRRDSQQPPALANILEAAEKNLFLRNTLSVIGIFVVGAVGWAIAWSSGAWRPSSVDDGADTDMAIGAQVLGYISAICYLGARIPQIIKNYREKSCEGLSLLFFILSLLGNLTYGGGIIFHSTEKEYIITNLPWLIGSLGTMVEDITIFVQFRLYEKEREESAAVV